MSAIVLLDSVASFLTSAGVAGTDTAWPIKKGFLPDDSDQSVTIFETPGRPPEDTSDGTADFDLRFQVRVRGAVLGYEAARAKMQEIMDTLHGANISGLVYTYLIQSGPMSLGNDGSNRPNLVINFKSLEVR